MSVSSDPIPLPRHGGDIAFATRIYGTPPGGWLDLSTGINPNPYPVPALPAEAFHRLPDSEALIRLIAAARTAYRVPSGVDLIAVPGSEIAIRLLARIISQGRVCIVSPTYGSHADAWRRQATEIASVAALPADTAVAVVVNPNNPDGRVTPPDVLADLAARLSFLVVDEAFADLTPDTSIIPAMAGTNAIVLRSLGKFYGLPGLRLGFVAATPVTAAWLGGLLGDWPVSGPALTIGEAALSDDAWRDATRARLMRDAAALRTLLARHNLAVVGGTDLFVLVETADAHALHRALAERGIWTRAFRAHPRWLRFGLPGDDGMDRLTAALSALR